MKRFKNIVDLLDAGLKPGPSENIRKIAAAFPVGRGLPWQPSDDFMFDGTVKDFGDEAANDLDEAGWAAPIQEEGNTIRIPDDVLRRCKNHPDWTQKLETFCGYPNDNYDPHEFLAWHCVLYVFAHERGLL